MRKILIVSPRFPPKNAPDMHRVRTSLPYYSSFGWEPTVLCLTPETCDGVDDEMLSESLPKDLRIVRVPAWSERACRRFGFGHVDYRGVLPLWFAGNRLLAEQHYDLIFFSSTAFLTFPLGRLWKRRFGSKVVYDFQDPWYQPALQYTKRSVPGAWWKYRFSRVLAQRLEAYALKSSDHIIAVSGDYIRNLSARYPWIKDSCCSVVPFGMAGQDLEFVRRNKIGQRFFVPGDGLIHWVYVGRGGPDMDDILAALFEQLAQFKRAEASLAGRLHLHFVGTNYAPPGRTCNVVMPLAEKYGVSDSVEEYSCRIPYYEALALHDQSDAILLVGSNLSDYIPSKLFNCIASNKPVLALLNKASPATDIASRFPNVFVASFQSKPSELGFLDALAEGLNWLRVSRSFDRGEIDQEMKKWSAAEMARMQCSIFSKVCDPAEGASNEGIGTGFAAE
jgi:hypothetical protein